MDKEKGMQYDHMLFAVTAKLNGNKVLGFEYAKAKHT